MTTQDQNFSLPTAGQSDWDSALNGNFTIIARGYHVLGTAGLDIETGYIVTVGSDGFYRPYDPNSLDNRPHAYSYKGINSGEQDTFLLRGMVRSLDINTLGAIPGHMVFGSLTTPGMIVASYSGADRPAGVGTYEDGFFFDPGRQLFPEVVTDSANISAVNGSLHLFVMDGGRGGFIRQVIMTGDSSDLTELQLWSNSARTAPLYETISGGVNVVGSFLDQGGLPFFNTDASTVSGKIYGTLQVMSLSVESDTVGIQVVFERFR